MSVRDDVEIDYCPECRGVWLDRGELDKIIDRSRATFMPSPSQPAPIHRDESRRYDDRSDGRRFDEHGSYGQPRKKKRRGFLEDLFEFD